ncbi:Helix-turn-helix [Enterococcus faecalis]|uniref:helix-turn-helix domain-containing protein n=1 Tax=Enterococcus faecalis TaxID=1351 RepID=UPI00053441AD|nr:helix-turn-helix transcriptional regulator [Enterococcus faecalis]SDN75989.1 Helix-turn-helix [Enterococcus faecalis]
MLNERISAQIRAYRTNKKMTLAELAQSSGIDDTYLGRVERNEINITLNTLDKIIVGLKMTPSEFFSFLDLESDDPALAQLMREVKSSPKREKMTKLIENIVDLSE